MVHRPRGQRSAGLLFPEKLCPLINISAESRCFCGSYVILRDRLQVSTPACPPINFHLTETPFRSAPGLAFLHVAYRAQSKQLYNRFSLPPHPPSTCDCVPSLPQKSLRTTPHSFTFQKNTVFIVLTANQYLQKKKGFHINSQKLTVVENKRRT